MILFKGGCFENDVAIEGNNIEQANASFSVTNVYECQRRCQSNWECNYFVFNSIENLCTLKKSEVTRTFKTNSLVGPKTCGK